MASDGRRVERKYRASAVVTLLGVPVFSRDSVGGAWIVAQTTDGVEQLEFAAGSVPERARGFNRAGYMREKTERGGSAYLGFMTASYETSLRQAQKNMESGATPLMAAGRGWARGGRHVCDIVNVPLSSPRPWFECAAMAAEVEAALGTGAERREIGCSTSDTFLLAIRRGLLARAPRSETGFVHNGAEYRLKMATSPAKPLTKVEGEFAKRPSGEKTEFTIWIDPADPSGLPERFEFKARSYLRLVFSREAGPVSRGSAAAGTAR